MQISYSLATIEQAAYQLWQSLHRYNTWTFTGDMGAGKTTLISALCRQLGVKDSISSPTFALINEYHFQYDGKDTRIFHMDWYRINSAAEAVQAGVEDCLLQPGTYSFVEWPERAGELLPSPRAHIDISVISATERIIRVMIE